MASPFRLQVHVLSARPLHREGYYSLSVSCKGCDSPTVTRSVLSAKGIAIWDERLSLPLRQKSTISLSWTLLYKPTATVGGKEGKEGKESVESSGECTLLQLSLAEERKTIAGTANKLAVFDSVAIELRVTLTRNTEVIRIVRQSDSDGDAECETRERLGVMHASLFHLSRQAFFRAIPRDTVRDCVQDANDLVETFVEDGVGEERELQGALFREGPKLFNGSKIVLASGKRIRAFPVQGHSLQLNLSADDRQYVVLSFSNRFAVFMWMQWIALAFRCWTHSSPSSLSPSSPSVSSLFPGENSSITHSHTQKELQIPEWAKEESLSSAAKVFVRTESGDGVALSLQGRCSLSLRSPFQLAVDEVIISLQGLQSVILSCDAQPGSLSVCELEAEHCEERASFSSPSPSRASADSSPAVSSRFPLLHRAQGAVLSAAKAARRSFTSQDTETGDSLPHTGRLSETQSAQRELVIKAEGLTQTLKEDHTGCWMGKMQFDDLFPSSSSSLSPSLPTVSTPQATLKYADQSTYRDSEGEREVLCLLFDLHRRLIGERALSVREMREKIAPPSSLSSSTSSHNNTSDQVMDLLRDDFMLRRGELDISFNEHLSFRVRLLRTENLFLPANISPGLHPLGVHLHCKCKLVDANGHSSNKSSLFSASEFVPFSAEREWNDEFSLTLRDYQQAHRAEMVRVELIVAWGAKRVMQRSLGAAFLPLSLFTAHKTEHVLPVVNFRRNEHLYRPHNSEEGTEREDIATMKLEIQRVSEKTTTKTTHSIPSHAQQELSHDTDTDTPHSSPSPSPFRSPPSSLSLHCSLSHHTTALDRTLWSAESISGSLALSLPPTQTQTVLPVERLYLRLGFVDVRIVLLDTDTLSSVNRESEKARDSLSQRDIADGNNSHNQSASDMSNRDSCKESACEEEEGWRLSLLRASPHAVLATSRDCDPRSGTVRLPYDRVCVCEPVTATVLYVQLSVHRFLPLSEDKEKDSSNKSNISNHNDSESSKSNNTSIHGKNRRRGVFQPAVVDVYVYNCPAAMLQAIIEERRRFFPLRTQLHSVVRSRQLETELASLSQTGARPTESVPVTESLSSATTLFAEMDAHMLALEQRLRELDCGSESKNLNNNGSNSTNLLAHTVTDKEGGLERDRERDEERTQAASRLCRLRLFTAALFGVGLRGPHDFSDASVRALIERDLERAQRISLDNEINTTLNRVDFLLDTAEKRIRDTAVCGWRYRGETLQRCLEMLTNSFFSEVVGLMSAFFEDEKQSAIKGLTSRLEVIMAFMQHNDRLQGVLECALRPYGLRSEPPAQLSLFLNGDVLLAWYTSVLAREMAQKVQDVLSVWRDREKDVSGQTALYSFPLPWIPLREREPHIHTVAATAESPSVFLTHIPEDLTELLSLYVEYAQVREDELPSSFRSFCGALDAQLALSYTHAMHTLSLAYRDALREQITENNWLSDSLARSDEEVSEKTTWLCSVMNDALRVRVTPSPPPLQQLLLSRTHSHTLSFSTETGETLKRMLVETDKDWLSVAHEASHTLSSLLLQRVFEGRESLVRGGLFHIWLRLAKDELSQGSTEKQSQTQTDSESKKTDKRVFTVLVRDALSLLQEMREFLSIPALRILFSQCALKLSLLPLSLLRSLRKHHFSLRTHQQLREALVRDIESARKDLSQSAHSMGLLLQFTGKEERDLSELLCGWDALSCAVTLVCEDMMSSAFIDAVKALQTEANERRAHSFANYKFLRTCLAVRGVSACMPRSVLSATAAPLAMAAESAAKSVTSSFSFLRLWGGNAAMHTSTSQADANASPADTTIPVTLSAPSETGDADANTDTHAHELLALREQLSLEWAMSTLDSMRAISERESLLEEDSIVSTTDWSTLSPLSLVFHRNKEKDKSVPLPALILNSAGLSRLKKENWLFEDWASEIPASISTTLSKINRHARSATLSSARVFLGTDSHTSSASSPTTGERQRQRQSSVITQQPHMLQISDLRVVGSLSLLSLSSTKFFLKVRLGDEKATTAAEESRADNIFVFGDRLLLPFRYEYREKMRLEVVLCGRTVLWDEKIASVSMDFLSFSPPSFANKSLVFTQWSESFRVAQAIARNAQSQSPLPQLIMSVSEVNVNNQT